jgi:hypothetical protein
VLPLSVDLKSFSVSPIFAKDMKIFPVLGFIAKDPVSEIIFVHVLPLSTDLYRSDSGAKEHVIAYI